MRNGHAIKAVLVRSGSSSRSVFEQYLDPKNMVSADTESTSSISCIHHKATIFNNKLIVKVGMICCNHNTIFIFKESSEKVTVTIGSFRPSFAIREEM